MADVGRPHHRPALLSSEVLEELQGGSGDPALREEAAHTTARLLVEGARDERDADVAARIVRLADEYGLEPLADLWSDSPADSLPGALWRLYALRQWVHADPQAAARQFAEGRRRAPVLHAVAGVADPPGPDQVRELVDAVLSGVARGDVATTFERAAAFARVVAVGRAHLAGETVGATALGDAGREGSDLTMSAARLVRTAEQLESAARRHRERPDG
ncbi:MAG: hypothetical protein ACOYXW_04215 [Actinomycetota bacterium]